MMVTNMFLTFLLGKQAYGLEITKIREIITYVEITEIPDSKPYVKGVINLRGEAVPIVDLRIRFNSTKEPIYSDKTIIIATKTPNGKLIGYIVDEVSDIETIGYDSLLPATKGVGIIDAKFLKGYIKKDSKMIVILDTDKILSFEEMQSLQNSFA